MVRIDFGCGQTEMVDVKYCKVVKIPLQHEAMEPEPEPAVEGEAHPMTPAEAGETSRQDRLAKLKEGSAANKLEAAIAAEASAEDFATEFAAASDGLETADAVPLLFTALADAGWKTALKLLKTHKRLIAKTVGDDVGAQLAVLRWLSSYGANSIAGDDSSKGTAGKAVAKFLYTLYELDMVEEGVILLWNQDDGCGDGTVKQAVEPIIEFLEEEEEDDESDSN